MQRFKSKNLITGKEYLIPDILHDEINIDKFLLNHKKKKVVVVQGLGFVGAVMCLIVANAIKDKYAVIGIDLANENSFWKIASLNEGIFPVVSSDRNVGKFFKQAKKQKNLYATYDPYAYSKADVIIVDINLDVHKKSGRKNELKGYEIDLFPLKSAIKSIAENCKEDVLILVETTVPPGTCQFVIKPCLDEVFAKRGLERNYKLGHSYERVMPGPNYINSIRNFYRVYSGINYESGDAVESFMKTIIATEKYPLTRLENTTATEIGKVLENSFRAMNIAFIQEWTEFAENAGVNLNEIISAIRMRPTHKNIMSPGLGVGGYCLTKDPLLASWASQKIFGGNRMLQSEIAVEINDQMPLHSYGVINKCFKNNLNKKRILILGVSYLGNVGDTRYTPVELLYKKLLASGANIKLHDPYISFWEETGLCVETDISKVLNCHYDGIILCSSHDEYKFGDEFKKYLSEAEKTYIIDTNGVMTPQLLKINNRHTIKVIGRGDL